jgi:hypothetical protein
MYQKHDEKHIFTFPSDFCNNFQKICLLPFNKEITSNTCKLVQRQYHEEFWGKTGIAPHINLGTKQI